MKQTSLIVIMILAVAFASAQGILRGKISDETGETLIGVSVSLKNNRGVGTVTDIDGNYSFTVSDSTPVGIVVSYVGYNPIEEQFQLKNGEVKIRNFTMKSSAQQMKEVEVTAKAVKAQEYYVEKIKRNSAVTIDYVSSESMKKTGDASIVAAVTRIPGISTNGDYYTVRGIGDRYVKTAINGMMIPTLDPFTNNIKLDLFPASLVDNVIVTKTASADLPADWSGAYLSIHTKDYPENLLVNVETTFGYNTQSSFQKVISSERSSTDWLGYDNGLREHGHDNAVIPNINPGQYEELAALGLAPYYNSVGINNDNWHDGTASGETYFKLGLVYLGLLQPALINDPGAVSTAKQLYLNGNYKADAFSKINSSVPEFGKSFPNNWNTRMRNNTLNFMQSFTIGNQLQIGNKPFGYLLGFRYITNTLYDPDGEANRLRFDGSVSSSMDEQTSKENNGWTGLVNLAYKPSANNSFSIMFMPNVLGTNKVRRAVDVQEPSTHVWTNSILYEQRTQLVYQYKSEHYIPAYKMKMEVNASYTDGQSNAPDFKNLQYYEDPLSNAFQIGGSIGDGIHRYYRYLNDNLFDSQVSAELPFKSLPGYDKKLKFGGGYQYNHKESDQYDYALNFGPYANMVLKNHDIDAFLNYNIFNIHEYTDPSGIVFNTIDAFYIPDNSPANHTFGQSKIYSAFVLTDLTLTTKLRISGGIRFEKANIFTDVTEFDSLKYPEDDMRRNYSNGYPLANPGKLDQTSLLPSANLIYKFRSDEQAPVNLRLNYSSTLARPSIRELSDVATFDYDLRKFVFGNSDLKPVSINNYDVRFEYYFNSRQSISVSAFDKEFKNHIELVESSGFTWQNVDKSHVYGIELEGKIAVAKNFDLGTNMTLVHSETEFVRTRMEINGGIKVYIPEDTISRAMFGQAPYVFNIIGTFHKESIGLIATVSYNIQGERLVIASSIKEIPDVYEMPRNLIDAKVSKKLGNHFTLSISVRDLLNTSIERRYQGTQINYDSYNYGTTYALGITYKL